MAKSNPGYEKEYCEKVKKLDIWHAGIGGKVRGYLSGKTPKETIQFFERIKKCACGGEPKVLETEFMGDYDISIACKKCGRSLRLTMYDYDKEHDVSCDELCLQKWNAGVTQAEFDREKAEAWEKKRLHKEDLVWMPVYPNNMPVNGEVGLYCLVFKKTSDGKIYCCKWTIEYQYREIDTMYETVEPPFDAYILHMKRYFDIKGPLKYPKPNNHNDRDILKYWAKEKLQTLHSDDVNDYGDFVRAYRTLEEAKNGALGRCGWQGLNRETVFTP